MSSYDDWKLATPEDDAPICERCGGWLEQRWSRYRVRWVCRPCADAYEDWLCDRAGDEP